MTLALVEPVFAEGREPPSGLTAASSIAASSSDRATEGGKPRPLRHERLVGLRNREPIGALTIGRQSRFISARGTRRAVNPRRSGSIRTPAQWLVASLAANLTETSTFVPSSATPNTASTGTLTTRRARRTSRLSPSRNRIA
jgi:hypothetical protein